MSEKMFALAKWVVLSLGGFLVVVLPSFIVFGVTVLQCLRWRICSLAFAKLFGIFGSCTFALGLCTLLGTVVLNGTRAIPPYSLLITYFHLLFYLPIIDIFTTYLSLTTYLHTTYYITRYLSITSLLLLSYSLLTCVLPMQSPS